MFKISTRIRYALRAIVRLAILSKDGRYVPLKEISENEDIPVKYLENIMQFLKKGGIVASFKGPGGGYKIKKNVNELTLFDVVKAFEGDIDLVDCCSGQYECPRKDICSTYNTWAILSDVLKRSMKSVKIIKLAEDIKK